VDLRHVPLQVEERIKEPSGPPPTSTCSFGSCVAKPDVDDAFSIRLSLSRLARNDSLLERATATPIWSYE
jgi:hypothetical protein